MLWGDFIIGEFVFQNARMFTLSCKLKDNETDSQGNCKKLLPTALKVIERHSDSLHLEFRIIDLLKH